MEQFREIIKKLDKRGIKVKRIGATLNGVQAYRVTGRGFNPAAIWTKNDILFANREGEFAVKE